MSANLEFGVNLSMTTTDYELPDSAPDVFERVAQRAEDAGFDVVVSGDHAVYTESVPNDYEFSKTGEPPFDTTTDLYSVFETLSYLARATDEIALGTNVCVAPLRHPVELSKRVLTVDALSQGRFDFGIGPGWYRPEYDVLDIPFEERGGRIDEFLEIFRRVCEQDAVAYEGEHFSFEKCGFHPRPVQEEIPVWIGGRSGATFRRVAEFGAGWSTIWEPPAELADSRDRLQNAWTDYDRSGTPEIAVLRPIHVGSDAPVGDDKPLVGDPDSIVADLEAYVEAGASRLIFGFYTKDVETQLEQLDRIGSDVLPSF